jgi:hypothetical protein
MERRLRSWAGWRRTAATRRNALRASTRRRRTAAIRIHIADRTVDRARLKARERFIEPTLLHAAIVR